MCNCKQKNVTVSRPKTIERKPVAKSQRIGGAKRIIRREIK